MLSEFGSEEQLAHSGRAGVSVELGSVLRSTYDNFKFALRPTSASGPHKVNIDLFPVDQNKQIII